MKSISGVVYNMDFFLMHKNVVVGTLTILKDGSLISYKLYGSASLYVPSGGSLCKERFIQWWKDRAVPKTRHGSDSALRRLGYESTQSMLVNNFALSLNDCYWIKPVNSDVCWEQVSLFRNNFVDLFGALTFDTRSTLDIRNKTLFHCATSQGELQKKWCIDNYGRRFLVKGNWGSTAQQSYNEILACEIHKRQGFNQFVQYFLTPVDVDGGEIGTGCYSFNFCNENVEFISAWELLQSVPRNSSNSTFNTMFEIFTEKCGLDSDYVQSFLDYQVMSDYVMTNRDRHFNNFGLLRNTDTLQWLCFAPIYDTGNSMFYKSLKINPKSVFSIETCSFDKLEVNLLKHVKNRGVLNLNLLPSESEVYTHYLSDETMSKDHIEKIVEMYELKIKLLQLFQSGVDIWKKPFQLEYFRS